MFQPVTMRDFFRRSMRHIKNPGFGIESLARYDVREFVSRVRPNELRQNPRIIFIPRDVLSRIALCNP